MKSKPSPKPSKPKFRAAAANDQPTIIDKLCAVYSRTQAGLLDRIADEREIGDLFTEVKRDLIPASGLTVPDWCREHMPFSDVYANGCARLAKACARGQFEPAHQWYQSDGKRA